jgi:CRISPR-associated protein Csb2
MALILEVEYLSGVVFAAVGPDSPEPDWPPQPDRIYSALVATWAARGEDPDEARALQWLEALPLPRMLFSDAEPRTSATVYVPPNDPRTDRQKHALGVMPRWRSRQPRRFPAARPDNPVLTLLWTDVEAAEEHLGTLQRLAADTAYVGHSASLTRCRFLIDRSGTPRDNARPPRRAIYAGRFDELRRDFGARRRPGYGTYVAPAAATRARNAAFSARWIVLEPATDEERMPDLRACAPVARLLRDTLMSGYARIGLGDQVPEVVSGHAADGSPSRRPHLAIIPLPHVGSRHADGHVMGFALVPPNDDAALLDDATFRKALRAVAPLAPGEARSGDAPERRVLTLTARRDALPIRLSPTSGETSPKLSLRPGLYLGPARVFATVTPILLDRHLKRGGAERDDEIAGLIGAACRNVGLPEPEAVVTDKHSALAGAPPAYPSGRAPSWTRWQLPPSLASRQLTHAVIRFPEPVEGPVILGAGRFCGLGLCRPLDRAHRDAVA